MVSGRWQAMENGKSAESKIVTEVVAKIHLRLEVRRKGHISRKHLLVDPVHPWGTTKEISLIAVMAIVMR